MRTEQRRHGMGDHVQRRYQRGHDPDKILKGRNANKPMKKDEGCIRWYILHLFRYSFFANVCVCRNASVSIFPSSRSLHQYGTPARTLAACSESRTQRRHAPHGAVRVLDTAAGSIGSIFSTVGRSAPSTLFRQIRRSPLLFRNETKMPFCLRVSTLFRI